MKAYIVTHSATTQHKLDTQVGGAHRDYLRAGTIYNATGATLYIGGATVTDTTGFPIAAGASYDYEMGAEDLYGYSVAGGTVNVLRRGD